MTRQPNPPDLGDRDTLLFDEPGRCGGMDSHCHHYRLVKNSGTSLLVRHGGGDERFRVSLPCGFSFESMDSNARYWILNAIYHASHDGRRVGAEKESSRWRKAVAEKRVKTRKVRGENSVKVTIE